jgi:hypothetical protein
MTAQPYSHIYYVFQSFALINYFRYRIGWYSRPHQTHSSSDAATLIFNTCQPLQLSCITFFIPSSSSLYHSFSSSSSPSLFSSSSSSVSLLLTEHRSRVVSTLTSHLGGPGVGYSESFVVFLSICSYIVYCLEM